MSKHVLVLSSVTAQQYQDIRLDIIREGHKPTIIRVSREELFLSHEELIDRYANDDEKSEFDRLAEIDTQEATESSNSIMETLAIRHLRHYEYVMDIGDLVAIVYDEPTWDYLSTDGGQVALLLDSPKVDIERWLVREGRTEYIG